ncbi:hypothetical protein [Curtobacterium sp. VKM Ac-1393]|uniref:hypothetical protein n=1 Tax=Curtobacterium sp. VKM Ac-1393 TaxID=2783814 RepID=UPI00188C5F0F|nr:hypothetical protein [Curtobacterium sp. VKM Ac-1393]MBF4607746.1 hypothetical protein [Curtobacterium sp. VKM Ac-1393]
MIDPQQTAREQLRPDEHLYWAGTSDPAKLFTARDGFLVPFSILWCGFAVFWTITATRGGAPFFFPLFGSVFVLMGLHLVFGRFIVKRHRKRTTVYAVTSRRALIITPRGSREVPVGRADRTVTWSGGRRHCTVEWNTGDPSGTAAFFAGGATARIYANTGLDGLFGPQVFAFWDVTDGEELVRELDRVAS